MKFLACIFTRNIDMIFKFQFTIKAYAKQRSFLNGCNHICRQYLQRLFFLFQIINKWFLLLLAFIELFVKQLKLMNRDVRSLLNCVPSVLKTCLRANVPCVLKTCSAAYVLCVIVCSCANVPCVLACSRAYVLCVLTYSRTNMP